MNLVDLKTQYDFLNQSLTMVLTYSLEAYDTDLNSLIKTVCRLVQNSTAFLPAANKAYTFDSNKANENTLIITCTHPYKLGAIAEYQILVNDTYTSTSHEQIRTYAILKSCGDTFKILQDKYKQKLEGYTMIHNVETLIANEPVVIYCYKQNIKMPKATLRVLKDYLHIIA